MPAITYSQAHTLQNSPHCVLAVTICAIKEKAEQTVCVFEEIFEQKLKKLFEAQKSSGKGGKKKYFSNNKQKEESKGKVL